MVQTEGKTNPAIYRAAYLISYSPSLKFISPICALDKNNQYFSLFVHACREASEGFARTNQVKAWCIVVLPRYLGKACGESLNFICGSNSDVVFIPT